MSLHIECGVAGVTGSAVPVEAGGGLRWSETVASAGTSTTAVPTNETGVSFVLTLTAEVDMWISIGQTPDASVVALRRRLKAGVPRAFTAAPGAKVAWSAT